MKRPLTFAFSVLAIAFVFAGCASTGALTSAKTSFERAKASGAESKTPFEYYAAEAYLQKAEHEASEGDSKEAKVFASESEKYSAQAIEKAGGGAK
jgi:ATP/maltotriose-dependent transcriptional regulator MalT